MKKLGFVLFPALSLGVGALAGYLTSTGLETVYPALEKWGTPSPAGCSPVSYTHLTRAGPVRFKIRNAVSQFVR